MSQIAPGRELPSLAEQLAPGSACVEREEPGGRRRPNWQFQQVDRDLPGLYSVNGASGDQSPAVVQDHTLLAFKVLRRVTLERERQAVAVAGFEYHFATLLTLLVGGFSRVKLTVPLLE